jgi:hypothetical protein
MPDWSFLLVKLLGCVKSEVLVGFGPDFVVVQFTNVPEAPNQLVWLAVTISNAMYSMARLIPEFELSYMNNGHLTRRSNNLCKNS